MRGLAYIARTHMVNARHRRHKVISSVKSAHAVFWPVILAVVESDDTYIASLVASTCISSSIKLTIYQP